MSEEKKIEKNEGSDIRNDGQEGISREQVEKALNVANAKIVSLEDDVKESAGKRDVIKKQLSTFHELIGYNGEGSLEEAINDYKNNMKKVEAGNKDKDVKDNVLNSKLSTALEEISKMKADAEKKDLEYQLSEKKRILSAECASAFSKSKYKIVKGLERNLVAEIMDSAHISEDGEIIFLNKDRTPMLDGMDNMTVEKWIEKDVQRYLDKGETGYYVIDNQEIGSRGVTGGGKVPLNNKSINESEASAEDMKALMQSVRN